MINNIQLGDMMTRFCKNCGAELEEGSIFCNECGTKAGEVSPRKNISLDNDPFKSYKINMINGENIIRSSQIHIGCLYLPSILTVLGFILIFIIGIPMFPILIVGLIWLLIRFIGYSNNDLILTNKRVFGKCGLISTVQMQSPLNKIDSVTHSNGLFGKLIGYGTVEIATTSSKFKFRFIREGQSFYNDIFNQLEASEVENRNKNAQAIVDAMAEKLS